jgi:hypothetical protein
MNACLSSPKGTVPVVSPNPPVRNGRDRPLRPSFYRWHKGKAKAQDKLEEAGSSRIGFPWSRYDGRAAAEKVGRRVGKRKAG